MTDLDFVDTPTLPQTVALDGNHINTLQELLNAVNGIPGVFERVEAYMIAREIEDPKAELSALHDAVF